MRWLLLAAPMLLGAASLRIDHVTIAGRDLKNITAALERAGIPMVYGGPHANGVTEMSLCSFPDGSYLEAIAPVATADPAKVRKHEWGAFLAKPSASCAWAIRSDDLDADRRLLQQNGIAIGPTAGGGRARPDGVRLEWQTADIAGGIRGTLFPFLIHDLTPRDRRAFPQGKPVTADFTGVAFVVIAVHDLDDAIAGYRRAFALPAPARRTDDAFGARLAAFRGTPVILAEPVDDANWLGFRLSNLGEGPCAFLLRSAKRVTGRAPARWFQEEIRWLQTGSPDWRLGFASGNH